MRSLPLIIVVGANDLALRVCEELCATQGHEVLVIWHEGHETRSLLEELGAKYVALAPNDYSSLEAAGIREAACVMPVSEDDRLNLQVALKSRDLNPGIRVVLRQFNRALGRKIEQNLADCSAISPATHAAATFAAAALDPSTLYAVQFPASEGPLVAFSERAASDFGLGDTTVQDAERRLGVRIVSVNGRFPLDAGDEIRREDLLVACGPVPALHASLPRRSGAAARRKRRTRPALRDAVRTAARLEPLLAYTFGFGTLLYFLASLYFMIDLHLTFIEALYFVAATMFTVGYGDITPYVRHAWWGSYIITIAVMGMGVAIGGVFIASISSALNRAQETALRGLRHIHAEDHVVVCGAGNVGTRVIEFLLELDHRVVVIEPRPSAPILELARRRRIDLLASDATDDETLIFCNLTKAASLVAVTDSDTANLESALGALAYNTEVPVVLRVQDAGFAQSIARNFRIAKTFSASDLTAPVIAGLSRFPASRGRVSFAKDTFNIGERTSHMYIPRAEGGVPLYVCREGNLLPVHDFDEMQEGDRVLDIVALSQFKPAKGM
jgi:Trk K+ transport system NAD-binding subunit